MSPPAGSSLNPDPYRAPTSRDPPRSRMRWVRPTLALVAAMSGCGAGGQKPFDPGVLHARPHQTVVFAQARPAMFTIGPTLGVPVLPLRSGAAGHLLVTDNEVVDPSIELGNRLVARFAEGHALKVKTPTPASMDAELADHSNSDLLLRVATVKWAVSQVPENTSLHRVEYVARLELYDGQEKRVLASSKCVGPIRKGYGTKYEKLLADKAALVKRKLEQAAAHCLEFFAVDVLKLPPVSKAPPASPAEEEEAPPQTEAPEPQTPTQ
jgi:hypothetical protein